MNVSSTPLPLPPTPEAGLGGTTLHASGSESENTPSEPEVKAPRRFSRLLEALWQLVFPIPSLPTLSSTPESLDQQGETVSFRHLSPSPFSPQLTLLETREHAPTLPPNVQLSVSDAHAGLTQHVIAEDSLTPFQEGSSLRSPESIPPENLTEKAAAEIPQAQMTPKQPKQTTPHAAETLPQPQAEHPTVDKLPPESQPQQPNSNPTPNRLTQLNLNPEKPNSQNASFTSSINSRQVAGPTHVHIDQTKPTPNPYLNSTANLNIAINTPSSPQDPKQIPPIPPASTLPTEQTTPHAAETLPQPQAEHPTVDKLPPESQPQQPNSNPTPARLTQLHLNPEKPVSPKGRDALIPDVNASKPQGLSLQDVPSHVSNAQEFFPSQHADAASLPQNIEITIKNDFKPPSQPIRSSDPKTPTFHLTQEDAWGQTFSSLTTPFISTEEAAAEALSARQEFSSVIQEKTFTSSFSDGASLEADVKPSGQKTEAHEVSLLSTTDERVRLDIPIRSAPTVTASAVLPPLMRNAAWMQVLLTYTERIVQLERGQALEVMLADGSGTMHIRAQRESDHVAIAVHFSDPALRTLAANHADRIQEALQAQYQTAVQLSLTGGESQPGKQHAFAETPQNGTALAGPASTPASGAPSTPPSRAIRPGSTYEWIG